VKAGMILRMGPMGPIFFALNKVPVSFSDSYRCSGVGDLVVDRYLHKLDRLEKAF